MDIPLIDEPDRDANPATGTQYAVRSFDGTIHVYGDQDWVASGHAAIDTDPNGVTVHRTVTVTYGEWTAAPGGPR